LRDFLSERGTRPVIPNNPTRKHPHPFDPEPYKLRNLIERMFCRLKDWRRIATRYDKLARNSAAAVAFAAIVIWWLRSSLEPSAAARRRRGRPACSPA
jgi:putative transposase